MLSRVVINSSSGHWLGFEDKPSDKPIKITMLAAPITTQLQLQLLLQLHIVPNPVVTIKKHATMCKKVSYILKTY